MEEIRCKKCNKLLGMINGGYSIKCPRCKEINDGEIKEPSSLKELTDYMSKRNLKGMC